VTDGVRIELDPGAQPLAGRVLAASGDPVPFSGYVELIAALELMRQADQPERDRDGEAQTGA
jgi:hypothetical protein